MKTATRQFETMLRDLEAILNHHFSYLPADPREEAVAEAVASAWRNWLSLCERGCEGKATAHTLAWYAMKAVRSGRRVGGAIASQDAYSQRVGREDAEAAIDWGANPARAAAFRIDFAEWTRGLTPIQRETASLLMAGFTTQETARLMGVSEPAISIRRRRLKELWLEFQGVGA